MKKINKKRTFWDFAIEASMFKFTSVLLAILLATISIAICLINLAAHINP